MEPVYFVVEARDPGHVFSASGWSQKAVGGAEHATEESARAELAQLLASEGWDRIDLRVGKRIRHPATITRVA